MAETKSNGNVIEILYADADLVRSFSSQILGGIENAAQVTHEELQDFGNEIEHEGSLEFAATLGLVGGTATIPRRREVDTDTQGIREAITREMVPHDNAILRLIEYLHPNISSETTTASGSTLVNWSGKLSYVDPGASQELMDRLNAVSPNHHILGTITQEQANQWGNQSLAGADITQYYKAILNTLPGIPFSIFTLPGNKMQYLAPVKPEYMRYSPNMMEVLYPSGELGKWRLFGLLHDKPSTALESGGRATTRLVQAIQAIQDIHRAKQAYYVQLGLPANTLLPLVIYQVVANPKADEHSHE